jgi:hypothetical protein
MNETQRQIALSALGAATDLAAVLLVFVAFVYSKAESIQAVPRKRQYQNVARFGFLFPFMSAMISAWLLLTCVQTGSVGTYDLAIIALRTSMAVTAFYAFVVVFMYL